MKENKEYYRPETIDVHFQIPAGLDVKFDGEDLWYEAMIKLAKLYKIPLKKVKKAIEEYGDNFYYSKVFRDMWKIIEESEKNKKLSKVDRK